MRRAWLVLVVSALAVPGLRAQADEGLWTRLLRDGPTALWGGDRAAALRDEALALAHRAKAEADAGNLDAAIATLKQARVAWPDSPQLAHMLADLHDAAGDVDGALRWYGLAAPLGEAFRAHYHMGQIVHARAEQGLAEANVPADADAVPQPPPAELIEAIRAGIDALGRAREHFLDALLERADARASESVSAITTRVDELQQMLDDLEDEQEGDGEGDDGQGDGDEPDDAPDDSGGEGDGDGQDGDRQGDDQPDENQDRPEEDGDEPPDDEDGEEGEGPPPTGEPVPPQALSPEQMQRLEDKLEQMAELAARLDALARQREREAGERDW